MTTIFHTIGIIGFFSNKKSIITYKILYHWLNKQGINIIIERQTASFFKNQKNHIGNIKDIGNYADLAIIIGGDGNMLRAAKILAKYNVKIIGINQGTLGFLTDINPHSALIQLSDILSGKYINEKRFILEVNIHRYNINDNIHKPLTYTAINEIVLHSQNTTHMIEFEVFIDNVFTFSQRSDGLIISTPTGSTAYSLSAGGPILNPKVNAILLTPMLPHTLSSRPLIIDNNSKICLKLCQSTSSNKIKIHCDNQTPILLHKKENILIKKSNYHLNLIHPHDYNYFKTLKIKLGWSKKMTKN